MVAYGDMVSNPVEVVLVEGRQAYMRGVLVTLHPHVIMKTNETHAACVDKPMLQPMYHIELCAIHSQS